MILNSSKGTKHEVHYSFIEAERLVLNELKESLIADVSNFGRATLILTGGQSIRYFLSSIAALDIPWEKITISLTDDRLVPRESKDSNEGLLLRDFFTFEGPSKSLFISLKDVVLKGKKEYQNFFQRILPLSCVIMSMGDDGHVASLFPEDEDALSSSDPIIITQRADFKRVSLSLPLLLKAKRRFILALGKKKCDFLESGNFQQFPLSTLFKESYIVKVTDICLK